MAFTVTMAVTLTMSAAASAFVMSLSVAMAFAVTMAVTLTMSAASSVASAVALDIFPVQTFGKLLVSGISHCEDFP